MKSINVGRYIMHDAVIRVFVEPERRGGETDFEWTSKEYITMRIGFGGKMSWAGVVQTMVHEVMETSFVMARRSYSPFASLVNADTGRFVFMCDHTDFTVICQHAGDMLTFLVPEVEKVWKKRRKQ